MDNLKGSKIKCFNKNSKERYDGIAFDEKNFYITQPETASISKFNREFNLIEKITLRRAYEYIVFDFNERCFWAITKECRFQVFKLDRNFKMIETFKVNVYNNIWNIVDISVDSSDDQIIIAFETFVIKTDKEGTCKTINFLPKYNIIYTGISKTQGISVCSYIEKNLQYIDVYDEKEKRIDRFRIANECKVKNLACYFEKGRNSIYILCKNEGNNFCIYKFEYNFKKCEEDKCHKSQASNKVVDKILKKIALNETALAQIFSNEIEKLQKEVLKAKSVEELLKINKIINEIIIKVTQIEQTSNQKIDKLAKFYEDCEDKCKR